MPEDIDSTNWPRTLAVFAAGNGRRLRASGRASKAMFPIKGRPLISYIFSEALRAGLSRLVLVTRPEDAQLRQFAYRAGFDSIQFGSVPPTGTLPAVLEAAALAGNEPFLLSTCDVFGKEGSVARFLDMSHLSTPEALVIFSACLVGRDATPIWIDAGDDGYVRAYGKEIAPTSLVSGSIRLCRSGFSSAIRSCVSSDVGTESQLMARLIRTRARAAGFVFVHEMIMDVDTPGDVGAALGLSRKNGDSYF